MERGRTLQPDFMLKLAFGIYVITNPDLDMEKMYSFATEAANKCKHDMNAICAFYDAGMERQEAQAQQISNEIDRAIQTRQLQVYLQPKYSLVTRQPCGAEALVRWNHPQRGMLPPGVFIPVIEQNGQILQLDQYMWEQVCVLLRRWIDSGYTPQPISVNMSRVSLYHPQVAQYLVELMEKYRIPRELFQLEITESAYMSDPELMKGTIAKLRAGGFAILMDDFGCGYSSLNTLKEIDVDILKVDMKFLPTGKNDGKSEKILACVLKMAHWLGLTVVVEGVETREQKNFLESVGCLYVQGYYFARPMPAEKYEMLLSGLLKTEETTGKADPNRNLDTLWSSDSKIGTLLRSIAVPFAILEYSNHQADVLRTNPAFTRIFQSETQLQKMLSPDELDKLLEALEQTASSRESSECECLFLLSGSGGRWYRLRLNYIDTAPAASLISATFSDVTSERMLEKEMHSVLSALKAPDSHKFSILIVEDSEISRELLRTMFSGEFDILSAADGKEGLDRLRECADSIALILLDMRMPVMDGVEFLAKKNAMPDAADIPVVVVSSDTQENTQLNMLRNGVNDYVTKPFVPELVKQRVRNVLEYSSRFRGLLREYQQLIDDKEIRHMPESGYSANEIRILLSFLGEVFDVVRIVDPADTAVVTVKPDGTLEKTPYTCFRIWGREQRCDCCSSICARRENRVLTKYELIQDDIFYVISRPVGVRTPEGRTEDLVLEMAGRLTGEAALCQQEGNGIRELLEKTRRKLYSDPATGAYNRRFLEEYLFLHHGQNGVARQVGFILLNFPGFQKIEDRCGRAAGQQALARLCKGLRECIRSNDSVVRLDDGRFLVILTNCEEAAVPAAVGRLSRAVGTIFCGKEDPAAPGADFGFAYTPDFKADVGLLEEMLRRAEEQMAANSARRCAEERP